MLTFQVETFAAMLPEGRALFPRHYEELALDKEKVPLAVDEERYLWIENQGGLHVCTVRADGALVGYFICTLLPHLHYKDAGPMAYTDVYYIAPEHRRGGAGFRLIRCVERTLKMRGVTKIYLSHKRHQDHSALFLKLGYRATDIMYTKLLKD